LLFNHEHAGAEVNIGPAQAAGLTSAQPAQSDQPPHHRKSILIDEAEEGGGLLGRPYRDRRPFAGLLPRLHPLRRPHQRMRAPRRRHLDIAARLSRSSPSRTAAFNAEVAGARRAVRAGPARTAWWQEPESAPSPDHRSSAGFFLCL
jgi:hypothetical protein